MTRAELIAKICEEHGVIPSKAIAEDVYNALCNVMAAELLGGGEVPLKGIGKLKAKRTKARAGRHPRTGAPLTIPAGIRVLFVANKELKDALKGEDIQ